jgi:hypothetical protein
METQLRYRGLVYDKASHEPASSRPVDHIYRGHHYLAPLLHESAPVNTRAHLIYRGHSYQSHSGQPSGQS